MTNYTQTIAGETGRDEMHRATGVQLIPRRIWLVALLAAVLHMAPVWHAQWQTPPGWTFTGNINGSPDIMQYRVWMRQVQSEGILVSDRFTTEPNRPHLPVAFYFLLGKLAQISGVTPEFVYAYAGAGLAFLLVLLLYGVIRQFMKTPGQAWWVLVAVVFGGGLGGYLGLISETPALARLPLMWRLVLNPASATPTFEAYRGNYVISTLFDTHFLAIWLVSVGAVFSLFHTLRRFGPWRLLATTILFLAATLLHLYEGILLVAITLSVVLILWRKRLVARTEWATLVVTSLAVGGCIVWQLLAYRSSGLPFPSWRAPNVPVSIILISYPLAWPLIVWGLGDYWRRAGVDECFVMGWAAGCLILLLSWPFYPYPDRGTMTFQLVLLILAGSIYFSRYRRVTPIAAVLAILLLAGTPLYLGRAAWRESRFAPDRPYMFQSEDHRAIIAMLQETATADDVMILDKTKPDWQADDLWLMPEFPGKLVAGHFFLTPQYEERRAEVNRFFEASANEQVDFLRTRGVRFVYVSARQEPARFAEVPGLVLLKETAVGSLFEFIPGAADGGPS